MSKGIQFLMKKNKIEVLSGTGNVLTGKRVSVRSNDGKDTVIPGTTYNYSYRCAFTATTKFTSRRKKNYWIP